MIKHSFRTLSKRLLRHIPISEKESSMKSIENNIQLSDWWQNADTVALTMPRKIELNVERLIKLAWKEHKTVVLPKCFPDEDHRMEFFIYTNKHELENVYLDLYEPKNDPNKLVSKEDIDLIIVPGLLFDKRGFRIGFGGGYYDRYLQDYSNKTASVAMEAQLIPYIPYEEHDIPVNYIVTENGIIESMKTT